MAALEPKILLVDRSGNEPALRFLSAAFDTLTVGDVAGALSASRARTFGLIVADIRAIEDDAGSFVQQVASAAPVVFVAPAGDAASRIAALEAGAADVIDASASEREIAARVRNALVSRSRLPALETERDRFLSLAQNSPYFIGISDADMRAVFVNRAGRQAFGIADDREIGDFQVADFFFPEDRRLIFEEFFPRVVREGSGEVEVRFRHFKTNEPRWMLYNAFALNDAAGAIIGFATVSRDVTADVEAREALRASERMKSALVDLLRKQREASDPDAIMATAAEAVGRHLGVNRVGFYEMDDDDTLHFSACWTDGTVPLRSGTFRTSGVGAGYLAEVRAGRAIGITDTASNPLTAGSKFVEIGARAVIGAPIIRHGRWHAGLYVNHATVREWTSEEIALVRDVAEHTWDAVERARAQIALRESEARFREVVEIAPQFIWVTRADGTLEYVNERWTAYSGLDLAASSDAANVAALMPKEDAATAELRWAEALRTGRSVEVEVRLRGVDGAYRWFLARTVPLRDAAGNVVRWFTASTDIHVQKEAARELEEVDRRKDEFLATLSHELRTPLTAGFGWVKLLQSAADRELLDSGLHAIEQSFQSQLRLVNDLLDVSRIVAGKMRIELVPTDLSAAVATALEIVRPTAEQHNIRLTAKLEPAVPVRGDSARLSQIAWNLLSNAIKFTPAGGFVEVSLRRNGPEAEIAIRDGGQGIDPKFLPYVFDRFRQADSSVTRRHGGLGLGLSIVSSLVEAHGGSVHAASDGLGMGATFTVSIPLIEEATSAEAVVEAAAPEERTMNGARVLVVDDDDAARNLMRTILETAGAEVRTFATVAEAAPVLTAWRPDVLVSDLSMPVNDGYSFVRGLRVVGNDVPAIAVTAYVRTEAAAREAGFQLHLAKPFTPEDLIAAVRALRTP